jgi:hypothetical protein
MKTVKIIFDSKVFQHPTIIDKVLFLKILNDNPQNPILYIKRLSEKEIHINMNKVISYTVSDMPLEFKI